MVMNFRFAYLCKKKKKLVAFMKMSHSSFL